MNRDQWYSLYREIRTPVLGLNLFPSAPGQRAAIGLLLARLERKEIWIKAMEDRKNARKAQN